MSSRISFNGRIYSIPSAELEDWKVSYDMAGPLTMPKFLAAVHIPLPQTRPADGHGYSYDTDRCRDCGMERGRGNAALRFDAEACRAAGARAPKPVRVSHDLDMGIGQCLQCGKFIQPGERIDLFCSEPCPAGPKHPVFLHEWQRGSDHCTHCGIYVKSTSGPMEACPILEAKHKRPRGAAESQTMDFAPLIASLERELEQARPCTCPMHGPTGLMAVGCTCGSVRR